MLKPALLTLLAATPAMAAPTADWSAVAGAKGLTAAIGELEALPQASGEDRFALAGFRFLRGVERALQARWRAGQSEGMALVPVFRLDLPPNPNAPPFDPALVEGVLRGLEADMDAARAPLEGLGPEEFALPVKLGDLWFDVTGNGTRDAGEGVMELSGALLRAEGPPVEVVFDRADADWLVAYTHMLAGASSLMRAFGPTEAITEVWSARQEMARIGFVGPLDAALYGMMGPQPLPRYPNDIDMAAIALKALARQPEAALTQAARDHWLEMIAANRGFWAKVETETDNVSEWIPNPRQVSALGPQLGQGVAVSWGQVLDETEALLTGKALAPATPAGAMEAMGAPIEGLGFDLAAWLEAPGPLDLVGVAHGMAFLPWLKRGKLASGQAMAVFTEQVQGNAPLYALWLN